MGQNMGNDADRLVERLATEFGDDLVRFISRRVRTVADARDLAQEAYVRLLRLERKDLIRDPRPYLYRIAANILYEYQLKRKAEVVGLSRWSEERRHDAEAGYVEGDAESLSLQRRLESVLGVLSPKCRAVLILHRREGMTYDEIGAKIGISSTMVKKYLAQALKHCRLHLEEYR
jgi:RNA polymerase sigma-70 factor (ECF subfamily)